MLSREIGNLFCKCSNCTYSEDICSEEVNGQGCEYYEMADCLNINDKISIVRDYIKSLGSGLVGKKLTRSVYRCVNMGITYDDINSIDHYYVNLINDCLYNIRHRKNAWVFNLDQLAEIFRFEPDVQVTYDEDDGVFYLWK